MIKSVISDLGKVLVFFDNNIFFCKIANYSPFSADQIAEIALANHELIHSFDTGKITPGHFFRESIKILRAEIDHNTFFSIYNDVFSPNMAVLKILKKVESKCRPVLLSNTDVMRFEFIKKKFPELLIFDEYILSYEAGYVKPHPQIYWKALEKAKTEAWECIFIDDREENVEAALNIGLNAVLFDPETDLEAELEKYGVSMFD